MNKYATLHRNVNLPLGIFLTILAMIFYALLNSCIKAIGEEIPTHEILFFENLFALLLFVPFMCKESKLLKTQKLGLITLRSIFGLISYYLLFFSVQHISLVDAALLNNTAPFFISFILFFWIRKKISTKQFIGISIGFVGVILILKPGTEVFSMISIIALASGFFAACAMTTVRLLSLESPITVIFYYLLISIVIILPFLWIGWELPSLRIWFLLLISGILMYFTQFFFTQSYRYACPSDLGPFSYTFVIVSGLIDWIIWKDVPTIFSLIGIILVIIGGTLTIIFSETKTHKSLENMK